MIGPKKPLPDFTDPPVIETLLGIQFVPLGLLSVPHFGLYWQRVRDKYPKQETKPGLSPVIEEFGSQTGFGPAIEIEVVSEPVARCWFIDQSSTQLIQVQKDRFIRNWRKGTREDVYPRYENLKPRFREDWEQFCEFLESERLGTPEINQCEVTYVNHIEIGKGWEAYGEVHKVIRFWSDGSPRDFLPEPEKVNINMRYLMPDKRGRLHVTLQPAIRRQDAVEILQLNITARGKPASSRIEDILDWFDMGHEWIVRGFADLTTREMHSLWGRTR